MPEVLDIFNGDAFSNVTLTQRVNTSYPFPPGFLSQLGLFTADGIYTLAVMLDEQNGVLRLIPSSPRGAPPSQQAHVKSRARPLMTTHLSREATINADELLGTRVAGTISQQTAQGLIDQRVEGPVGLKAELAYTFEHMYLGAVDGQVYDADNATVLFDFYSFYGLSRPASIAVPFTTSSSDGAQIRKAMAGVRRQSMRQLNGLALGAAQAMVLCGDNFFDALISSKEYLAFQKSSAYTDGKAAMMLSMNMVWSAVVYADTIWVNYRGSDDSVVSVPTNEGRFFFNGVPGLFQAFFAPADTFETVSAQGLPFFLLQLPERQTSKQRVFEIQSNPAMVGLRPLHQLRLTMA